MRRKPAGFIALGVVAVATGWIVLRLCGPASRFPQGSDIQLDDFAFSVTGATPVGRKGGEELYALKIRVRNHARRVDYMFKPEEVAAEAVGSKPLDYLGLNSLGSNALHPNEEREFTLLFKGPPKAKALEVRFTFGGPLGTALESIFFGRKVFDVAVRSDGTTGGPGSGDGIND